jgi:hypothetical protein
MEGEGAERLYTVLRIPEIEIHGDTSDQLSPEVRKELAGKRVTLKTLQDESQGLVIKVFKVDEANDGNINSIIRASEPSYFAVMIAGTKPDSRLEKVARSDYWKLKGAQENYFQGLNLSNGIYHVPVTNLFVFALFEKLASDYNSRGSYPSKRHEKKVESGDANIKFLTLILDKNIQSYGSQPDTVVWHGKIEIPESKVPVVKDQSVTVENKINFRQQNTLWTDIKWFVGALFENF